MLISSTLKDLVLFDMTRQLKYDQPTRNCGVYSYMPGEFFLSAFRINRRRKKTKSTYNSRAKSIETRNKQKSSQTDVTRSIPTKKEIRQYCRQDDSFRELDDYIIEASNSYRKKEGKTFPGYSKAHTKRAELRAKILKNLPFGPIL